MICKKCGNEMNDADVLCPNCGADIESEANQIATEDKISDSQQSPDDMLVPDIQIEPVQKSKKKLFSILTITLACVAAIIACFFIFKDSILGLFMKAASDEKQLQYAYSRFVEKLSSDIALTYSDTVSVQGEDIAVTGSYKLQLSKPLKDLFASFPTQNNQGMGLILNQLKLTDSVGIDYRVDSNYNDGSTSTSMAVKIADKHLLSVLMTVDVKSGLATISIPELSDTAVRLNLNDMQADSEVQLPETSMSSAPMAEGDVGIIGGAGIATAGLLSNILNDPEIAQKILPDAELLEELLPALVTSAFKQITDAKSEKAVLKIEGVEQKADLIKAVITEDTVSRMVIAVLKELRDNQSVKKYISKLSENLGDAMNGAELYSSFREAMDNAIEEFNSSAVTDRELFTVNTYINGKFDILAVELIPAADEDINRIFIGKAESGNDTAYEIGVYGPSSELIRAFGEYEKKNDKVSGNFKISLQGLEYIVVEYKDVDVKKLEKEIFSGELQISLGEGLAMIEEQIKSSLAQEMGIILPDIDFSITIKSDGSQNAGNTHISFNAIGSPMLEMSSSFEKVDLKPIEEPSKITEDINEWITGLNMELLKNKLVECGISSELLALVMGGSQY